MSIAIEDRYDIVVADPPWPYNFRGNLETKFRGGIHQYYDSMKIEDIYSVGDYLKKVTNPAGSMLFLWGTFPKTEWAMECIDKWGYTLKTCCFLWVKKSKAGNIVLGTGYYAKANAEPCWLGTTKKGRIIKPFVDDVSQVVETEEEEEGEIGTDILETLGKGCWPDYPGGPYVKRKHSEKPEEVQNRIDRMYPKQRKIELFARRHRPGWTCCGIELSGLDIREELEQRAEKDTEGVSKPWLVKNTLTDNVRQAFRSAMKESDQNG